MAQTNQNLLQILLLNTHISADQSQVWKMPLLLFLTVNSNYCFRTICIVTEPGTVIKQAEIKMVAGEGMPVHRDPFNKGRLIIIFNITYPEKLEPSQAKKLLALLPKVQRPPVPAQAEEVSLQHFDGKAQTD
jgi:DnaJ-class molecular chaperone